MEVQWPPVTLQLGSTYYLNVVSTQFTTNFNQDECWLQSQGPVDRYPGGQAFSSGFASNPVADFLFCILAAPPALT